MPLAKTKAEQSEGRRPMPKAQVSQRREATPGSLAAQHNAEANGKDPMKFFYPYGNAC